MEKIVVIRGVCDFEGNLCLSAFSSSLLFFFFLRRGSSRVC